MFFLYVFTPCVYLFWFIPKKSHFGGSDQNGILHSATVWYGLSASYCTQTTITVQFQYIYYLVPKSFVSSSALALGSWREFGCRDDANAWRKSTKEADNHNFYPKCEYKIKNVSD